MSTHIKTIIFVAGACVGLAIGEVSKFASEVAVMVLVILLAQVVIHVAGERYRKRRRNVVDITSSFSIPLVTILICVGVFLGVIRSQLEIEKNKYICETSCTFDARIVSSPEIKNEYQVFKVHAITTDDSVYDIQIRLPLYPKYHIGEMVRLSGKVSEPRIIFPHGDKRAFDYVSYLETNNVGSEMIFPQVKIISNEANSLTTILARWKEYMVGKIDMNVSSPESSLASGMLFGATSMSKELLQTFRVAGLSHIIVLSGFNIAILITAILFVFTFLPLFVRVFFAGGVTVLFVMMVGSEASVIRATFMAFIALLATVLGREYVARQALVISFFCIIFYEPQALLHDVSLHLSFLATAGIVYLVSPLTSLFKNVFPKVTSDSFRELSVTTLSAYFATLPYSMYTFGSVSVYALLANVVVLPFVSLAMLLTFFVVVFSYVSDSIATLFGYVDSVLIGVMIWIAEMIASLPGASFLLSISFTTMCSMYILFVLIAIYFYKKMNDETRVTKINGNLTDIISY